MCRSPVPSAVLAGAVLLACASPKGFQEPVLVVPISPEAEAGAAFMEGHLLEMQGRLLEAVEAYAEAARLDPESAQIQRVLARVRARAGQGSAALEHAERAYELDPEDEGNRRTLAGLYVALKRNEEAVDLLAPLAESLSMDGLIVLFNLYAQLGRSEEARGVAERMLEPDEPVGGQGPTIRVYLQIGRVYERTKQWEAAEDVYRRGIRVWPEEGAPYDGLARVHRALKDPSAEVAALEEKLGVIPGDPTALLRLAQIREAQGDRAGAVRALEVVVGTHPEHVNARLQLGFFDYQAGQLKEAVSHFEYVAARNPSLHEVRYFLGVLYQQLGEYDRAIENLREVPAGNERFAEARSLLARTLEQQGLMEDALLEARHAVAADPEDVSLQVYLAGLLQRGGDLKGGVKIMKNLVKEDPENAELLYDFGVLYGETGDEDRALEWMDRALEKDPSHASALNYIGYTWAESGIRLDEAERMIRQALEIKPNDGYIADSLGWVLYKRGLRDLAAGKIESAPEDLAQAVQELERARDLAEPEDPIISRHLGDAYRAVSRSADALAAYRRALELDPKEEDAIEIRRTIELIELQLGEATSGAPR